MDCPFELVFASATCKTAHCRGGLGEAHVIFFPRSTFTCFWYSVCIGIDVDMTYDATGDPKVFSAKVLKAATVRSSDSYFTTLGKPRKVDNPRKKNVEKPQGWAPEIRPKHKKSLPNGRQQEPQGGDAKRRPLGAAPKAPPCCLPFGKDFSMFGLDFWRPA